MFLVAEKKNALDADRQVGQGQDADGHIGGRDPLDDLDVLVQVKPQAAVVLGNDQSEKPDFFQFVQHGGRHFPAGLQVRRGKALDAFPVFGYQV
jgi:hypothetical protein